MALRGHSWPWISARMHSSSTFIFFRYLSSVIYCVFQWSCHSHNATVHLEGLPDGKVLSPSTCSFPRTVRALNYGLMPSEVMLFLKVTAFRNILLGWHLKYSELEPRTCVLHRTGSCRSGSSERLAISRSKNQRKSNVRLGKRNPLFFQWMASGLNLVKLYLWASYQL